MRITKGTDVALRVLMVLAGDPGRRATIDVLARELEVPRAHVAKVVQTLARLGWVTTTRGRGGGLSITEAGRAVRAGRVVAALEGEQPVVNCHAPPCPLAPPGCRLQGLLDDALGAFMAALDAQTIEDLAHPALTMAEPAPG